MGYVRLFSPLVGLGDTANCFTSTSSDGKTITLLREVLMNTARSHVDGADVECYNLDGIPLTEINKTHTSLSNPTLDTYDLTTTSIARLGIQSGGPRIEASQNIQFETLVPQIERMLLPGTDVTARINTISGTSVNDGTNLTQSSFSNDGVFSDITLSEDNELFAPSLICSAINESSELSGAKSFRMDLTMTSTKTNISPVIDTRDYLLLL